MKCFNCGAKAEYKVKSLELPACSNCYSRIIEKRFKKAIKGIKSVSLTINRPSDYVLKHLFEKAGIKTSNGKHIKQFTLDDYAVSVIKSFFLNKDLMLKGFSPLSRISEEELINYSIINNLSFKGNTRSGIDKDIHSLLLSLDKRRPGVLFSIKSFLEQL